MNGTNVDFYVSPLFAFYQYLTIDTSSRTSNENLQGIVRIRSYQKNI